MTTLNRQLFFVRKLMHLLVVFVLFTACSGSSGKTDAQLSNVKYETYHNDRYEFTVEYPDFLIPQGEATNEDGQKFLSKNQDIQLIVYCDYKSNFLEAGDIYMIGEAYEEELKLKEGVTNKKLGDNHYLIQYKVNDILHFDYAMLNGENYFNIQFLYPEKEDVMMKDIIEHVINSFKVEMSFPAFLEGFLNDCYWGKNFNTLLRDKDKTLATYIDPKMDVRRYYAPGTITRLGTRDEDFGFSKEDDFITKSRATSDLIFEYVNDNSSPCELLFSEINSEISIIYYVSIERVPDVVVNTETFETRPVETVYSNAKIMAAYLPNLYGNPVGFYFINTPDGWKLAFIDDTLCGA
ncbi:MAG: hypothetical protein PHP52_07975 [Bacteroidales bacterium]|nr:hypothetical protein [Bacteroidales bacterium]MDD4217654.1 hypothetical protein [Bacteroidales bacterium]MDY0142543.1 hypothetical protein [Bacteroidales bacterium]